MTRPHELVHARVGVVFGGCRPQRSWRVLVGQCWRWNRWLRNDKHEASLEFKLLS